MSSLLCYWSCPSEINKFLLIPGIFTKYSYHNLASITDDYVNRIPKTAQYNGPINLSFPHFSNLQWHFFLSHLTLLSTFSSLESALPLRLPIKFKYRILWFPSSILSITCSNGPLISCSTSLDLESIDLSIFSLSFNFFLSSGLGQTPIGECNGIANTPDLELDGELMDIHLIIMFCNYVHICIYTYFI